MVFETKYSTVLWFYCRFNLQDYLEWTLKMHEWDGARQTKKPRDTKLLTQKEIEINKWRRQDKKRATSIRKDNKPAK